MHFSVCGLRYVFPLLLCQISTSRWLISSMLTTRKSYLHCRKTVLRLTESCNQWGSALGCPAPQLRKSKLRISRCRSWTVLRAQCAGVLSWWKTKLSSATRFIAADICWRYRSNTLLSNGDANSGNSVTHQGLNQRELWNLRLPCCGQFFFVFTALKRWFFTYKRKTNPVLFLLR